MKASLTVSLIVAALAIPAMSYAQSAQSTQAPVTRSEVNAQIVQAEKDGTLHQSKVHYPDYAAAQTGTARESTEAYGTMPMNFSQSGAPSNVTAGTSLFSHH
ncbi:DUF4148 domain-containing protein [Paraburkholderia diazotrophica]|uniref:DUF4148 domain-containing protein n=1 Tax=Paraburkholderia diazotrophica TaxID=667676 RepID=A0A1H7D334_9BURK|nr:DUF4148 domain-containing protein [Paraburkholderia diazotrophica]SEJ93530.1 protein of unknown function [Paraburkholderia diazotrophica]